MFRGRTNLNLDAKGRLAIPALYRDEIAAQCAGQFTVTADSQQCLLIYPKPTWDAIEADLMQRPNVSGAVKLLQRKLVGQAKPVELDSAGRLLIPPELRAYAGLEKTVTLIGQKIKFELWDEAKWDAEMARPVDLDELKSELQGFSW